MSIIYEAMHFQWKISVEVKCLIYFQQASGVLSYMRSNVVSGIQCDPTPDLQPDTLNALSQLMLAQAQDCFVRKAMNGENEQFVWYNTRFSI